MIGRVRIAVAFLGLLLSTTSCRTDQAAMSPGPPIVRVTMSEYAFRYPVAILAGREVFQVYNGGRELHRMALVPLAGPLSEVLDGLRAGIRPAPIAAIPNQDPGKTGSFAVDLVPGRYALLCLVADNGGNHALRGMAAELEAR